MKAALAKRPTPPLPKPKPKIKILKNADRLAEENAALRAQVEELGGDVLPTLPVVGESGQKSIGDFLMA